MTRNILNVSQLVNEIKQTLEFNDSLRSFYLKAELSNFTAHRNGHWYFSLKDERSRISAVMFQSYASLVAFNPKEGDQVLVRATVSVYAVTGSVQINVFSMENAGLGALYQQYEQLKAKLQAQNIFDQNHKKPIPKYPNRIALVTGANTAALQDMLKTAKLRWPRIEIILFPSLVQGVDAPKYMIQALKKADESLSDIIILARGGGSIEDLWAFNDESLAMTIYHLNTPIITGVGHEIDTTIVDFVSDLRAATPTAAMTLALPDIDEVKKQLTQIHVKTVHLMQYKYQSLFERFESYRNRPIFLQPSQILEMHSAQLSIVKHRMLQSIDHIRNYQRDLIRYKQEIQHRLSLQVFQYSTLLESHQDLLVRSIHNQIRIQKDRYLRNLGLLEAYSPLKILARGYGLIKIDQTIIKGIDDVKLNASIEIEMVDGKVYSTVYKKEKNHE